MLRIVCQQFFLAFQGDQLPFFQHGDPAAQCLCFFQIVGGQYNRVAKLIEFPYELPQVLPQLNIHTGGRLIQHNDWWAMYQGLCDHDAAFHAARQGPQIGICLVA